MNKIIKYIYRLLIKSKGFDNSNIKRMLSRLNPGRVQEELFRDYYFKKIRIVIILSLASIALVCMAIINDIASSKVDKQGKLARNGLNGMSYDTHLVANLDDEEIAIDVNIPNQKYSKIEIEEMSTKLFEIIPEIILGENDSLEHVTKELSLPSSQAGYPFTILWESSDVNLMDNSGQIDEAQINEKSTNVNLKCTLKYDESIFEREYEISIFPKEKTQLEIDKEEIIASIQQKQIETQEKEYLQLPMSVGNKGISWRKSFESTGAIVALLALVAVIGSWWAVDNDLTKKYRKRDQLLRIDYSEFVSKLQLLISSGMTLRGAFERMEADYRNSLINGLSEKYVYEELSICLKRLRDGASESEVYLLFGNRCGLMSYKKLMTLLVQNLKKGTGGLLNSLDYESRIAFEERKHLARRLGEEAQTKLLLPMIMMLSVVMIIILVPAYFSFAI